MNTITNDTTGLEVELTNGATTALINALVCAGSELARSDWEKRFVCWIAENDQAVVGSGMVEFDVMEIAWSTVDLDEQRAFVLKVADRAGRPQLLQRLGYESTEIVSWLARFADLIRAVRESSVSDHDWEFGLGKPDLVKCETHDTYMHGAGCVLCGASE